MSPVLGHARAFALLGWLAVLAGCTGDQSAPQSLAFEPRSAGDTAIVVVGLRVLTEPTEYGLFKLVHREVHPVYNVSLRQVTEDGFFGRLHRQVNICESSRPFFNGAFSDCTPQQAQYKILTLPAGRYTLDTITYKAGRNRIITTFNGEQSTGLFGSSANAGDPVRNLAFSFVVAGGTITYVGNLTFYFDPESAGAHFTLTLDDAAAQRALAAYTNVHGTPVFQPATGTARLRPVPGALMPIEGPL